MESNEQHRHLLLRSFVLRYVMYIKAMKNKLELDLGYFNRLSPVVRLLCFGKITKPGNNCTKHDKEMSFFIKVLSNFARKSLGVTARL